MSSAKVAAVSLSCTLADTKSNLDKIFKYVDLASKNDCDLVLFPELATSGYALFAFDTKNLQRIAESIPGNIVNRLTEKAREDDIYIGTGILEWSKEKQKLYNSAVLVGPEGLVGSCRKLHLYGEEKKIFEKGAITDLSVFDTRIGKIGMTICYDFEFPEVPRILAMKGAEIILRLAAEASPCEEQHNVHPRSRALENGVFVVDSNRVGDEGGFHFFGRSQIVAPDGRVLAWTDDQEENIIFASLDKGIIQSARKQNPYLLERRPEIYSELLNKSH